MRKIIIIKKKVTVIRNVFNGIHHFFTDIDFYSHLPPVSKLFQASYVVLSVVFLKGFLPGCSPAAVWKRKNHWEEGSCCGWRSSASPTLYLYVHNQKTE